MSLTTKPTKWKQSRVALILFTVFFQYCGSQEESKSEEPKAVKYAIVEQSGGLTEKTYSGVTLSSSSTNLSFRASGLLVKLNARVGQRVRKGTLLAQLDQKDAKLSYDQSLLDVQNAKVQYDASASNFDRTKQLYETNNVSLSDYEQAKSSYASAQSSYEVALKRLDLQKSQIDYTEIVAPMTGVISSVNSEINEVVNTGTTIIMMSAEGKNDIEAQVGIPEKYINDIQNGDEVTISVRSINQTFKGSVTEIGYASLTGVTYPVTIALESSGNKELRPDMPIDAIFQFGSKDQSPRLVAPLKAIASDINGNFVYTLTPGENAYEVKKVIVELGDITQRGYEIKSGLNEGDLVAVAGLRFLYEGRKVKLLDK